MLSGHKAVNNMDVFTGIGLPAYDMPDIIRGHGNSVIITEVAVAK